MGVGNCDCYGVVVCVYLLFVSDCELCGVDCECVGFVFEYWCGVVL